jgi:hypothetical protein
MKARSFLCVLSAAAGAALSGSAMAQERDGKLAGLGINIGVPLYAAYSPSYPAPYYPPLVVAQAPSSTIPQDATLANPSSELGEWYYCADDDAYYPFVLQCPGGWQRVPAGPPSIEWDGMPG